MSLANILCRILFLLYNAQQEYIAGKSTIYIENMDASAWLKVVDLSFVDPLTQTELGM